MNLFIIIQQLFLCLHINNILITHVIIYFQYLSVMMKKSESSYKTLYTNNIKGQSRPKLSSSSSALKLNAPQYLSNKENQSRNVNRPLIEQSYQSLQPRMRKEFKLYSQLEQDDRSKIKVKVQRLEELLKNKISDEGFMKFFKTSNSNTNMTHIDIYLQMIKFEEAVIERGKQIKQLELKLTQSNKQIQNLLASKEEISNKHLKEVKMFSEVLDKMRVTSEEGKQYKQKYIEMKQLCDQIKKQRIIQFNQINELKSQVDAHKQTQSTFEEIQLLQEKLTKEIMQSQQFQQQNIKLINQNLKLKDDHQKQYKKVGELSNQILELKEQILRKQDLYKQCLIKSETLESICKAQEGSIKQKQVVLKEYSRTMDELKETIQTLRIEADYQKCSREKIGEELIQLKTTSAKLTANVENYESIKKSKTIQIQALSRQKTQLSGITEALQEQIRQLTIKNDKIEKEKIQLTNQLKQTTLNEKRLNTEKYRFILKFQEYLGGLKQFNTFEHPSDQDLKQNDKVLSELINVISNVKQRIYELENKIQGLESEKSQRRQNAFIDIEMKEETIKLLLKFVPECCSKLVDEYLMITEEELVDLKTENMGKRISLIDRIGKEAIRAKDYWKELEQFKIKIAVEQQAQRKQKEIQKIKQKEKLKQKQLEIQRERKLEKQKERERLQEKQRQRQRQRQIQRQNERQRQIQIQRQREIQRQSLELMLKRREQQIEREKQLVIQRQSQRQAEEDKRNMIKTRNISNTDTIIGSNMKQQTRFRQKSSSKGDLIRKKYFE